MKLILVHGIKNHGRSTKDIQTSWLNALEDGWRKAGLVYPKDLEVSTANYGDDLARFADAKDTAPLSTVAAGPPTRAVSQEELLLYQDFARSFRLTDAQILSAGKDAGIDMTAIPQAFPHEGWLIAIANALLKLFPELERPAISAFLRQAAVYLENFGVRENIKKIVREQVFTGTLGDRAVVVGHSLGSVVAYELLSHDCAFAGEVPLFVTIGSPLPVNAFRRLLGQHNAYPNPPVACWVNGRHPDDFVTLSRPICKESLGFDGVEDVTDIENNIGDKHSDVCYLSSVSVARRIHEALTRT